MSRDADIANMLDRLAERAGRREPEWDDVIRRSQRHRVRSRVMLAAALAIGVAIVTPAVGLADRIADLFDGSPVEEQSLSPRDWYALTVVTRGRPLDARGQPLGPRSGAGARRLGDLGLRDVRLIAKREGRAFYVIGRVGSGACYATGPAKPDEGRFGSILCPGPVPGQFPSRKEPILDISVFRGEFDVRTGASGPAYVWRLAGYAVDAIASVGIVGTDGVLRAVTPVEDNVYVRTRDLPTTPAREIVAFDVEGKRAYSLCVMRGGCDATSRRR